jgi:transcriptional antiterminator RfaH
MQYWTVAQTESQRETVAVEHLQRGGFETYLPKIKTRKRIEPLFPGYIFVRIVDQWHAINATIAVLRVLTVCEHPAVLDDRIIAEIRQRESPSGFVRLPTPQRGRRVRILRGSFAEHIGIYDGPWKDRERVLLSLLGRMCTIHVPQADLQFVGR